MNIEGKRLFYFSQQALSNQEYSINIIAKPTPPQLHIKSQRIQQIQNSRIWNKILVNDLAFVFDKSGN